MINRLCVLATLSFFVTAAGAAAESLPDTTPRIFIGPATDLAVDANYPNPMRAAQQIRAAIAKGEPASAAKAAIARRDYRFIRVDYEREAEGIVCALIEPPMREVFPPIMRLSEGKPDELQKTIKEYVAAYNAALAESPDYPDADLCKAGDGPGFYSSPPTEKYSGVQQELREIYWVFDRSKPMTQPIRPNTRPPRAITLHRAARLGLVADLQRLLATKSELNESDDWGMTPLAWAAVRGHTAVAEALISAGGDPNSMPRRGMTVLSLAALSHSDQLVDFLLEHGADPNVASDVAGFPDFALSVAINDLNQPMVSSLLKHGAKADAFDSGADWTPLSNAAARGHLGIMSALLDAGAQIQGDDDRKVDFRANRVSALGWAAIGDHKDAVDLLLAHSAKINWTNRDGDNSPLDGSIEGGSDTLPQYLLSKGADPNFGAEKRAFPRSSGTSPLDYAVRRGRIDIAKLLLSAGAHVNERQDGQRRTVIFSAAGREDAAMIKLLLNAGADPNARDDSGQTPIFDAVLTLAAAWQGKPPKTLIDKFDGIEALLRGGSDINVRDRSGDTVLTSQWCMPEDVLEELLKRHADPNLSNLDGQTPIYKAIERQCDDVAIALLKGGARTDVRDQAGHTPRDYALYFGRDAVVSAIEGH